MQKSKLLVAWAEAAVLERELERRMAGNVLDRLQQMTPWEIIYKVMLPAFIISIMAFTSLIFGFLVL